VNNQVQTTGIDSPLLDQRKNFLRPDSLLAIVVVSDESDTSIKESGSFPLFAAPELHLPHPRSECATSPVAMCCSSCGAAPPSGCAADPACTSSPSYTSADENTALRAFGLTSHKARYGLEFFYQPSRYVSALTSATVVDASGHTVPNPIYSNLDPAHYPGSTRDPSRVFYATITGVPWQLIARQKGGVPDLVGGVSTLDATQVGGFKSAAELSLADPAGNVFWDDIAGDPERYVAPKSPFMQESTVPRSGADPITGATIAPSSTPNGGGSSIGGALLNDHERTIATPADEIEYACIFDLPQPRDCSQPGVVCDCRSTSSDDPLCQGTMQVKAKAYPGVKELSVARGMGAQGIVASICPKQLSDSTASDYGYRPAVATIVHAITPAFRTPCLTGALTTDANKQSACVVFVASPGGASGSCPCDASRARTAVSPAHQYLVDAVEASLGSSSAGCFCEAEQLSGAPLADCQTKPSSTSNGWCYVDEAMGSAEGALVSSCPASQRHAVRFVGASAPTDAETTFLACP
jgi:hypothetical protein